MATRATVGRHPGAPGAAGALISGGGDPAGPNAYNVHYPTPLIKDGPNKNYTPPEEGGPVQCPVCKLLLGSVDLLKGHLDQHTEANTVEQPPAHDGSPVAEIDEAMEAELREYSRRES